MSKEKITECTWTIEDDIIYCAQVLTALATYKADMETKKEILFDLHRHIAEKLYEEAPVAYIEAMAAPKPPEWDDDPDGDFL